jgi:hypothetical protein
MINLVNTLMHQKYRLVVRPQQTGRERPLPKCYRSSLDAEAHVDSGFYLRFCYWGSRGKEVGCNGARGFGSEGCFEGHIDRNEEMNCGEAELQSGLVEEERVATGSVPATISRDRILDLDEENVAGTVGFVRFVVDDGV